MVTWNFPATSVYLSDFQTLPHSYLSLHTRATSPHLPSGNWQNCLVAGPLLLAKPTQCLLLSPAQRLLEKLQKETQRPHEIQLKHICHIQQQCVSLQGNDIFFSLSTQWALCSKPCFSFVLTSRKVRSRFTT